MGPKDGRLASYTIPAAFALVKLLMQLPVLYRYGRHHDEL
jgi:hypothetical protein